MTHTSPPRVQPGRIVYRGHPAARHPHTPIRVTEAEILAALPNGQHGSPHKEEIIADVGFAIANCDIIDGRRDADGNLSLHDASDYEIYSSRILPALRRLNLYPADEA